MFDYKLMFVVKNKEILYYFVNEVEQSKMNVDTPQVQLKWEDLLTEENKEKPKKTKKKSNKSKKAV